MSKKALHRAYDRLTPEERLRLDVMATARGDLEESERLTRTCQRETYTMNHRGYTGRWTGTYEITDFEARKPSASAERMNRLEASPTTQSCYSLSLQDTSSNS